MGGRQDSVELGGAGSPTVAREALTARRGLRSSQRSDKARRLRGLLSFDDRLARVGGVQTFRRARCTRPSTAIRAGGIVPRGSSSIGVVDRLARAAMIEFSIGRSSLHKEFRRRRDLWGGSLIRGRPDTEEALISKEVELRLARNSDPHELQSFVCNCIKRGQDISL